MDQRAMGTHPSLLLTPCGGHHMYNWQVVRILRECILVKINFYLSCPVAYCNFKVIPNDSVKYHVNTIASAELT